MLSLTTPKHQTFVTFPGITGGSNDDFGAYAEEIDRIIDRLLAECRKDDQLPAVLGRCSTRLEACQAIARHLPAVTAGNLGARIAGDVCRRVLFLLCPDRFGFEKYGWIH